MADDPTGLDIGEPLGDSRSVVGFVHVVKDGGLMYHGICIPYRLRTRSLVPFDVSAEGTEAGAVQVPVKFRYCVSLGCLSETAHVNSTSVHKVMGFERPSPLRLAVKSGHVEGSVTKMEEFDLIDLNYLVIYKASAQDRVKIIKRGIKASVAKRIVADLDMPAALTCDALNVPISTINRKAKAGAVLRSDEGERVLGLAKLVGQVESMTQGVDGAERFDARAWMSRWLREPMPALGGAAPLDYMDTMEGQTLVSDTLARIQSGAYG
jgi:putative toxin-antitoxin system antitoxin component (TIGR02293 family)